MKHLTTAERIGLAKGLKEGRVQGRVEGKVEGKVEGIAIGEAKGIRDSIREILEVRNVAVAPEWMARLETIDDLELLRRLRKLLFAGGSVADFDPALPTEDGR